jgi:arsenate reductase
MAEAILRLRGGSKYDAHSAGTSPVPEVNPYALEVLRERGADIRGLHTKKADSFVNQSFDLVVTVCDKAKQVCPFFPSAKRTEHWSIEDPATFQGSQDEILRKFRKIRDEIEQLIVDRILRFGTVGKSTSDNLGDFNVS